MILNTTCRCDSCVRDHASCLQGLITVYIREMPAHFFLHELQDIFLKKQTLSLSPSILLACVHILLHLPSFTQRNDFLYAHGLCRVVVHLEELCLAYPVLAIVFHTLMHLAGFRENLCQNPATIILRCQHKISKTVVPSQNSAV